MRASQTERTTEQTPPARPQRMEFNSEFLRGGGSAIDISRFADGNAVEPGLYHPDLQVNGDWVGRAEVRFTEPAPGTVAQPCFDPALLEGIGVDLARVPAIEADAGDGPACLRIEQSVPGASARFNIASQRLEVTIPQILMRRVTSGHVGPEQWDAGVPAGLLGYDFNTYHARGGRAGSSTQGYLGLNSGFNYARWHFRHSGSFSWSDQGPSRYQSISAYVQRDIADWSSQLILGDTYTDGEIMDSVSFRGLRLRTDDRMLPESQRGFAPVVRGVANSNARVVIRQNGIKLRETTVAPGAFVIDDLYPTGYGGDLQVDVEEADGSLRSFSVPYAAVPRSLREGQHRYSLTAGAVRGLRDSAPFFSQAGWQYGFSNMLTAYGGATVARGYFSPTVGAVLNTSWGAFGLDLTHASTRIPHDRSYSGQSLRATYAKTFPGSGTGVSLAAYRYSTNGFFGINEAMRARELALSAAGGATPLLSRPRTRAAMTLSQHLGEQGGNLSLSASMDNYWNREGRRVDYTLNYSSSWLGVPYNLSASRQRDAWGRSSTLLYAGVAIPLGPGKPRVMSRFTHDSRGGNQLQASTYGQAGSDLSYGLNAEYGSSGNQGSRLNAGANALYRRPYTLFSGSVSAGRAGQQLSLGARGALVAHPGGVTLSQPLGETFAIVQAPHAEGARLTNAPGVRIDARGYAVVPYMTPYAMNEVSLDPKGMSMDVELQEANRRVAPVAGAAAMVVFRTAYSRSAVLRLTQADTSPVPFGAVVSDESGKDLGMVGQAGKLMLRGLSDQGQLHAQWKAGDGTAHCSMAYSLPARERSTGSRVPASMDLHCVPSHLAAAPSHQAALTHRAETSRPIAIRQSSLPFQAEKHLGDLRLSLRISVLRTTADAKQYTGQAQPPLAPDGQADNSPGLRIDRSLVGELRDSPTQAQASVGV
ncbi:MULTISPECIES: fimbria/pilus outer membrane usher protein [unclassified Delftia]|uniref:fimbria/pilus outer membrane usher protein n=1 Tax=unclassified Delftia TaxID=2613839 RepID=UPI001F42C18F|nr:MULTISPECIES: fimbria/pilus outer membrane usher protein [unclassified Delftia]